VLIAAVVVFIATAAVQAQQHEPSASPNGFSVSLGDKVVALPPPDGYEEVASQFERMKTLFAASHPPGDELLAVYMPVSDCDLLRNGQNPRYVWYMKISVRSDIRSFASLRSDFAAAVNFIRKNNAKLFSPENKEIKDLQPKVDKALSKELSKDVTVNFAQAKNLGDFVNKPNAYSNLMVMSYKAQIDGKDVWVPVLTAMTLLHVKQRILAIFAYKRYDAEADAAALKQLTTDWIAKILAAN
jgi:hypothetical protein